MMNLNRGLNLVDGNDRSLGRLSGRLGDKDNIWVLTGAGISAASGIPTYRNHEGVWQHSQPIQHDEFVHQESSRKRYWARSLIGWANVAKAIPNPAHVALTALQQKGKVSQLVTQNVDRLHSTAGTRNVIDLHGRLDRVVCLTCRHTYRRSDYQIRLEDENPTLLNASAKILPDGDAEIDDIDLVDMRVPECEKCAGVLMPDVVFFGGSIPKLRTESALSSLRASDCVLIIGSSLSVYSGFRFVKYANELELPVYAINQGTMRGESLIELVVPMACEVALPMLVDNL